MSTGATRERGNAGPVHEAMPYRNDREFLATCIPYIQGALATDEPVLVAIPGERADQVRVALGPDADRVQFGDMAKEGRNPGRIIPWVLRPFAESHPDRRAAIVAESMWPGRSAAEYAACVEHEALLNLAFDDQDVSILCPYNLSDLPEQTLSDAERTHPALREGDASRISTSYMQPQTVVEAVASLQPGAPMDAERIEYTTVAQARRAATEWGTRAGLPAVRLTDLAIAVSEVCGNTVAHAGGAGAVLCWQDRGSLILEVRDGGHIQDLLAGRLAPPAEQESGRGLLMVNLLCDLVQIKTGRAGTAIRVWMTLPSS